MNPRITLIVSALAAGVLSTAHAMPPLARRATGTVEAVDLTQRRIVVHSESESKPLTLAFDRRTAIWSGSEAATPSALSPGQTVQVTYRLPFFGPDYASRIVLLTPGKTNKPNRKTKP
jgi:hypothetical protein